MSEVLSYASVPERRAPLVLQRLSLLCAIAPAIFGVFSLIAFWVSESEVFALMGFFTLMIGGVTLFIGLVMSLFYLALAWRATIDRPLALRRGVIAISVLLLTIPLAALCTWAGTSLVDRPKLNFVIKNVDSSQTLSGMLYFGNSGEDFGPIAPGKSQRLRMRLNGNGRIAVDVNGSTHVLTSSSDADTFLGRRETTIEISGEKASYAR